MRKTLKEAKPMKDPVNLRFRKVRDEYESRSLDYEEC